MILNEQIFKSSSFNQTRVDSWPHVIDTPRPQLSGLFLDLLFCWNKRRFAYDIEHFVLIHTACNCFGHSTECHYDEEVAKEKLSIDIHGFYEGGGVCENCEHNTAGINCNKCKDGYYRPAGRQIESPYACESKCLGL